MKTFSSKKKKRLSVYRNSGAGQAGHHFERTQQAGQIRRILEGPHLQPKLKVSDPNDAYEQEADRVADAVMRMPDEALSRQPLKEEEEAVQTKPLADQITPLVQRQEEVPEEEEEILTKTKPGETPAVTPDLESRIQAMKDGGHPLSPDQLTFFEPRMGRDFSNVRIHNDSEAADTAQSVNARAFTLGKDIVFNSGQYTSGSQEGKKLLAHELTHVVQQGKNNRIQDVGNVVHRQSADATAVPTTDTAIENLDLAPKAKAAAYAIKAKHPTITFTSGRRSKNEQARAMASNVVLNRNWIKETYSNTTARRKCQEWVDNHPAATTKSAIQAGLKTVLDSLTNSQLGALSKHLSGEAFDVQPVTENAAAIKADIRALPGIKKFLEREGGLTRWHAEF